MSKTTLEFHSLISVKSFLQLIKNTEPHVLEILFFRRPEKKPYRSIYVSDFEGKETFDDDRKVVRIKRFASGIDAWEISEIPLKELIGWCESLYSLDDNYWKKTTNL